MVGSRNGQRKAAHAKTSKPEETPQDGEEKKKMNIPPKQNGKTSKYHFDDLLKKKKLKYTSTGKQTDYIRSAASTWAKKRGVRVTTRLCKGGISVYLLE